jgi:hypothetical protein
MPFFLEEEIFYILLPVRLSQIYPPLAEADKSDGLKRLSRIYYRPVIL